MCIDANPVSSAMPNLIAGVVFAAATLWAQFMMRPGKDAKSYHTAFKVVLALFTLWQLYVAYANYTLILKAEC